MGERTDDPEDGRPPCPLRIPSRAFGWTHPMKNLSSLPFARLLVASALMALASACGKTPEPVPPVAPPPVAAIERSDLDVTESVKTALLSDEATKGMDITVVTLKGDVRLTGVAATQLQMDRAVEITHPLAGCMPSTTS